MRFSFAWLHIMSKKKRTSRVLLEPQCTGAITSSRYPLCLEIDFMDLLIPARCDRDDGRLPLLSSQHSNMGSRLAGFEQKRSLVRNLRGKVVIFTYQSAVKITILL